MKRHRVLCFVLFMAVCGLLTYAQPALPQETGFHSTTADRSSLSLSASYMHQFDADLDGGGDFRVDRLFLRAEGRKKQSETVSLGIGINYDFSDYSFSEDAFSPLGKPWDQVHALNLSVSSIFSLDKDWKLFIAPSVGIAAASGAEWDDSLVYGGIIWTSYRFTPELALGIGAGLFSKPEDFTAFPIIVVDWKISDRLRLSNPLNQGPTGPAGLELSYMFDGGASVAAGGAYRSLRFRLDDRGSVPGGVGEEKAFPLWIKFSTKIGTAGTLSLLGGAMVGGKLTIEDSRGSEIMGEDYDASPFLSATLSFRF